MLGACGGEERPGGGDGGVGAPDASAMRASCERPASCTGDVVGRWRLVAACDVFDDEGEQGCGVMTTAVAARLSGEWVFDGAELSAAATYDVDFEVDYPPACMVDDCVASGAGQGLACEVTITAHCRCTATVERDNPGMSGPYTLEGTLLTVTSSDTPVSYQACVDGDVLHVTAPRGRPRLGFQRVR